MTMNTNAPLHEQVHIAGVIDPDAYAAGGVSTAWIDIGKFGAIMATTMVGTMATGATLDAKLEQAKDATGTGAKDIDGKAIVQMTQAGTDQSDRQAIIECRGEELDVNNGYSHVRLSLTISTAACDAGAIVHGVAARYPQDTAATVDQAIT